MNRKKFFKSVPFAFIMMTAGCLLYSLGVTLFLESSDLASGGLTGIAIIISEAILQGTGFYLNPAYIIFGVNVPLIIWGWIYFGKKFFIYTAYSVTLSSLLMVAWEHAFKGLLPFSENVLLNACIGGALFGAGMGLIFRSGGSSGGIDVPVKVLKTKFRHIPTSTILLISDCIIVGCSVFVFRDIDILFYTLISVIVFNVFFHGVLYGGNSAKVIYVICSPEKADAVAARVLGEIDSGATFIDAEGAYSRANKKVLVCVIKPSRYPALKDVIHDEDDSAFIIVTTANEVFGNGYQNPNDKEV